MRTNNRFEEIDKAAMNKHLLKNHKCPYCRKELQPVAFFEDVWGCRCGGNGISRLETWYIPKEIST